MGWALRMLATTYQDRAGAIIENMPGGLRGYLILVALADGEPPSQLALARRLTIDRTVMTYLIDALEEAKLVTRRPDPSDRRARLIALTAAGEKLAADARRQHEAVAGEILTALTRDEAAAFRKLLSRVAVDARTRELDSRRPQ